MASSVCSSLQCLIYALTQGVKGVTYLSSLVQLCCGEGRTLQTNITGLCGKCSQCLGHTGFPPLMACVGFPGGSVGKESACNAGDPGSIPRSGRSAGEGIGYPHQYSRASLVAQLVKNWPAMCKTWVRSLSWEDPLEKGTATHSSILARRIPWTV